MKFEFRKIIFLLYKCKFFELLIFNFFNFFNLTLLFNLTLYKVLTLLNYFNLNPLKGKVKERIQI